jgi:oligosaccharide repeat unit polymerase
LRIPIFILIWFVFWLILANFSIGGVYPISYKTNIVALIGILGFIFGMFVASTPKNVLPKNFSCNKYVNRLELFYSFFNPISLLLLLLLVIKFIWLFISDPLLVSRLALFGNEEEPSLIFGSQQALLLYTIFVKTILKSLVIIGFYLSFIKQKSKYFLVANLIWLLDSILFLGRGALLEFIFQIIFYLILCKTFKIRFTKSIKRTLFTTFFLLILLAPLMSLIRGDEEKFNLKNFFYRQVINYHTVGYVIFDQELNNNNSRLNTTTSYGRATLGGIERFIVLFIRRFDKNIDSISGQNGEYLNEFRLLGKSNDGTELYYNAFATLFYSFYLDGGILFVFFGFAIFSFFLSRVSLLVSNHQLQYLPILYLLFQFGINSLYGSPIENTIFWYVVLILFLFRKLPYFITKNKTI